MLALLGPVLVFLALRWRGAQGRTLFDAALAVGLGLGATGCAHYVALVTGLPILPWEVLALLGAVVVGRAALPVASPEPIPHWVVVTVGVLLVCALYRFVVGCWASPEGDWDAWAIWNLRARFLHRGGDAWAETFSPLIPWSHPDYPLLVPLTVARGWSFAGETPLVPQCVGGLFTFGTVALLVATLTLLRGATQGLLAGCVLLGTVGFIDLGHAQYADVPLGYYLLATASVLVLHDRHPSRGLLVLAGFLAGCAAWTKNEGALFVVAVVGVRLLSARRDVPALLLGLLLPLALLAHFKLTLAPPNDLVAEASRPALFARLSDLWRYLEIAGWFVQYLLLLGPGAIVVLFAYGLLVGWRQDSSAVRVGLVLAVMLAGYFVVYLNSPWESVAQHIATSLDRLLLQLLPMALLGFFLVVEPAEVRSGAA